jgi:hypothetical protein
MASSLWISHRLAGEISSARQGRDAKNTKATSKLKGFGMILSLSAGLLRSQTDNVTPQNNSQSATYTPLPG